MADVSTPILWLRNRDARWVKPVITLKVKHLAFGRGLLRHATVRGLAWSSHSPVCTVAAACR